MSQAEPAAQPSSLVDAVKRYLRLKATYEIRDKARAAAKAEVDRAEQDALKLFEVEGVGSIKVGGRLVVLTRTIRANPRAGAEEALAAALHQHGLDDLVRERVSSQTLSAWIREQDAEGEPVPDAIKQHLNVAEIFGLSNRKATR